MSDEKEKVFFEMVIKSIKDENEYKRQLIELLTAISDKYTKVEQRLDKIEGQIKHSTDEHNLNYVRVGE